MENIQYEEVPNIISCKDLNYLSDMFDWNYGAYKNVYNASNNVNDTEIKELLDNASNVFYEELGNILNILNGGINNG